jgi:hypothetical protein
MEIDETVDTLSVDAHGEPGTLVLPPEYSKRIFYVSFIMPLTALYALYLSLYDLFAVALVVFVNSVNYWRHPVYGNWRRSVDILCVFVSLLYMITRSVRIDWTPFVGCYHLLLVCCGLCYANAKLAGPDKNTSSKWHVGMHIYGNCASFCLFYCLHDAMQVAAAVARLTSKPSP